LAGSGYWLLVTGYWLPVRLWVGFLRQLAEGEPPSIPPKGEGKKEEAPSWRRFAIGVFAKLANLFYNNNIQHSVFPSPGPGYWLLVTGH
jgi:hypothetical protein